MHPLDVPIPADDPMPDRRGPDGYMSREYAAWESRQLERVRLAGKRRPARTPLRVEAEVELRELDLLIAEAEIRVADVGQIKLTLQRLLDEVRRGRPPRFHPQGIVEVFRPSQSKVARLEEQLARATKLLAECRAEEERVRGMRLRLLHPQAQGVDKVHGTASRGFNAGRFAYNPGRIVDGVYEPGHGQDQGYAGGVAFIDMDDDGESPAAAHTSPVAAGGSFGR